MPTIAEILKSKGIVLSEEALKKVPLGEGCPGCGEKRRRYIHSKRQMRFCLSCGCEWEERRKGNAG